MPVRVANSNNSQNGQPANTLADILISQGAFSTERGKSVKLAEIQTGKPQEAIIRDQNLVTEAQLVKAIASLHNIPYIDLDAIPVEPEALAVLPQEVAER